ncbi:glycosyltransferase family 2 protein [Propionispira raffinosivorans]|uniref:glycosyltransferase family 2 protein n=1 Tax=Propionispira raffinosivorans TaxID=86959 RepID=UPI0003684151|nr:glycosyltransferase [Propionispira raffinosivorans]
MNSKISIIIPVYNTVLYLRKCLQSICKQTYKNLEIICIDDGSFDGSEEIVDEFAARDKRLIAIHKKNGGESNARNCGLRMCTGDYVTFVDCDDWIEPEMYMTLITALEQYRVDMVAAGYYIDTDTVSRRAINNLSVATNVFGRHRLMEYVYRRDDYRGFTGYIWCKIYKREILQNKNKEWILFDDKLKIGGDILYFSEVILNTHRTIYIDQSFYHYYQRETSTYHSEDEVLWGDILRTYQIVIENFTKKQIKDDILVWIKRFLVYRSELVAEMAYRNKNQGVLQYSTDLMREYQKEYLQTNQQYSERIRQYYTILDYKL